MTQAEKNRKAIKNLTAMFKHRIAELSPEADTDEIFDAYFLVPHLFVDIPSTVSADIRMLAGSYFRVWHQLFQDKIKDPVTATFSEYNPAMYGALIYCWVTARYIPFIDINKLMAFEDDALRFNYLEELLHG